MFTSHLPKISILLISLLVGLLACEPLEIDNSDNDNFPLNLTIEKDEQRGVRLSWDEVKVSSFEEYIIIRAIDSLPFAPSPFEVETGQEVALLDDFTQTSFVDESLPPAGKVVYRVYANIGGRFLASNAQEIELDITTLAITPRSVKHNPGDSIFWIHDRFAGRLLGFNLITNEPVGPEINVSLNENFRAIMVEEEGEQIVYILEPQTSFLKAYNIKTGQELMNRSFPNFMYDISKSPFGDVMVLTGNRIWHYNRRLPNLMQLGGGLAPYSVTHLRRLQEGEYVMLGPSMAMNLTLNKEGQVLADKRSADFSQNNLSDVVVAGDGSKFWPQVSSQIYDRNLTLVAEPPINSFNAGFSPTGNEVYTQTFFQVSNQIGLVGLDLQTDQPTDTILLGYTPRKVFPYGEELVIVGEFCCLPFSNTRQTVIERFKP